VRVIVPNKVVRLLEGADGVRGIIRLSIALAAGTKLGGYEILSLLGEGGMGEVYRAHDPILKRDVAIKVLPQFVSQDPERMRRFQQEALNTTFI
jgi:serine/threonine protein kinase